MFAPSCSSSCRAVLWWSNATSTWRSRSAVRPTGGGPGPPGFTRPAPTAVFAVTLLLSMGGLGYALRTIPVGTGYAVWVGIGVAGTAVAGMALLHEPASLLRMCSLLLVLAGVVGLKVFH
jgi:quaternary ammonium compound-resistance protein SugE